MARKRPCRICRKWFYPSPQAADRQKVCSHPTCQRERHRKACKKWHQANPDYDRERRLVERLRRDDVPDPTRQADPLQQICWKTARDAASLQVSVIIQETSQVLLDFTRDAAHRQQLEFTRKLARLPKSVPRDAFDCHPPSG
jgi:triphosphoribosyl-dephospho-CoA synthetase